MIRFTRLRYGKAWRHRAAMLVVLGAGMNTQAETGETAWYQDINWHGFASQGFSYTDNNNFLGSSEDGSFKFNEAGLNGSWRGELPVHYSAQILYKQTGNAEFNGLSLDFAMVDWRAIDTFDYNLGLRAGRLKNPYGFYNETRDVAATRPSILLPEGIYIDYLRDVLHSSDSIGAYGARYFAEGNLSFSAVYGQPILNKESVNAILSADTGGQLDNERALSMRISYEEASGAWRLAASYIQLDADFEALAGSGFNSNEVRVKQLLFSAATVWEQWELSGEFQRRTLEYKDIYGFYPFDMDKHGQGWYVQLGYHFTPEVSAFMRREVVYLDRNDKDGSQFAAATEALPDPIPKFPARDGYTEEMAFGLRYEPSFNWQFSAEFHQIDGTLWLPSLENPDSETIRTSWNLLLLQAAYRF